MSLFDLSLMSGCIKMLINNLIRDVNSYLDVIKQSIQFNSKFPNEIKNVCHYIDYIKVDTKCEIIQTM